MSSNIEIISCPKCNITFCKKKNLYRHNRKFHATESPGVPRSQTICGICNDSFKTMADLHVHYEASHPDIDLSFEQKTFYNMENFEQWKLKTESETQSLYVRRNGGRPLAHGRISMHYFCHRSGCFKPRGKYNARRLKSGGSLKIGSSCPAHIVVNKSMQDDRLHIDVKYQSVHVGHVCEISTIPLAKSEKDQLAEMLGVGISKTDILDSIKNKFPSTKRIALVQREDLRNICRDYKIINEVTFEENIDNIPVDTNFLEPSDQSNSCNNEMMLEVDSIQPQLYLEEVNSETVEELKKITNRLTFEQRKACMYSRIEDFAKKCLACRSEEELSIISQCIDAFETQLTVPSGNVIASILNNVLCYPVLGNVEVQDMTFPNQADGTKWPFN